MMPAPDDPRAAATAVLPPGHQARTLEPSPPASLEPPWSADDPTDPDGGSGTVVTPVPGEGTTWSAMAATDATIASFASAHWLDGRRRLERLPVGNDVGRRALRQVAFYTVAPKRFSANGWLGLRYPTAGSALRTSPARAVRTSRSESRPTG